MRGLEIPHNYTCRNLRSEQTAASKDIWFLARITI